MISSRDAIMVTDPSRQSDHIHGISDDAIALLASIPLAVVGIIANALAACVARSFHNSFGVLCCGLCITNCAVLLVLVAWMIPAISIGGAWTQSFLSTVSGHISNGMFYASILINLIMGINRLFAIILPVSYAHLFTIRCAMHILFVVWFSALLICSPYYFDGCSYHFDVRAYLWGFDETPCGNFLANFVDFYFSLSVICMTIFVDSITLVRLCVLKQIKQKTSNVATGSNWIGARRKKNPEAVFFLQSLLCTAIHVCGLTSFHIVVNSFHSKWGVFACTTMVWISAHTLTGFVFLAFNWRLFRKRRFIAEQTIAFVAHSSGGEAPNRRYLKSHISQS